MSAYSMAAFPQLPERLRRPDEHSRVPGPDAHTDAAGATREFAAHLAVCGVEFSVGASLAHLDIHAAPPAVGHPEVNRACMWGALLAASFTGWLHTFTGTPTADGQLRGHGVRNGKAMIATVRHHLIRVPVRLVHHADALILRLPPLPDPAR